MQIHGSSLNPAALRLTKQSPDKDNSQHLEKNVNSEKKPFTPANTASQSPEQIELILNDIDPTLTDKPAASVFNTRLQSAIAAYNGISFQRIEDERAQLITGIDLYV